VQIYDSDLDHVVRLGAAVLKIDLHGQDISSGWVELELVVVAEPVVLRPAGDWPYGRKLLAPCCGGVQCPAETGEQQGACGRVLEQSSTCQLFRSHFVSPSCVLKSSTLLKFMAITFNDSTGGNQRGKCLAADPALLSYDIVPF